MSYTLTLKSRSSVLQADYFPPIDISQGEWCLALTGLETYNSIPNITTGNNKLIVKRDGKEYTVEISPGTYDIDDLNTVLKDSIEGFDLRANVNTFHSEIKTEKASIHFNTKDSIGPLLGFSKTQVLTSNADKYYKSDQSVDILPVTSIRVECNITTNSYLNNSLVHTIYGFFPTVAPGYKIIEVPRTIIYLPVSVQTLDHIELRIVDQNDQLIDFRGEEIIIRLHLKKVI